MKPENTVIVERATTPKIGHQSGSFVSIDGDIYIVGRAILDGKNMYQFFTLIDGNRWTDQWFADVGEEIRKIRAQSSYEVHKLELGSEIRITVKR
jgi:hypothetical protein